MATDQRIAPTSARPFRGVVFTRLLTLSLWLGMITTSYASHVRFSSVTWAPMATARTIQFKFSASFRTGFYPAGSIAVGKTITEDQYFYFGDGQAAANRIYPVFTITSVNAQEDYFFAEATFTHTYAATGNYRAYYRDCCRLLATDNLINNANSDYGITTLVNVGSGNSSPVSSLAPIVNLAVGIPNATFLVPASSPNGKPLSFSLASPSDLTLTASQFTQPTGLSITSSGQVTFNTVGKTATQLYDAAVRISDGQTYIVVDFLIKLVPNTGNPPVFVYGGVTPANGSTIQGVVGTPISFSVKANDTDANSTVTLNGVGLPPGSSFSSVTGNGTATSTFSYTPTVAGNSVLTFSAIDNIGKQTLTSVTLQICSPINPTLSVSNNGELTCSITSVTLTANGNGGNYYVLLGPSTNQSGSTNKATVSQPGIYTIIVSGNNSCPTSVTTAVVSNTAAPGDVTLNTSGTLTCAQTSVVLTAGSSTTGVSYVFSGTGITAQSSNTAIVNTPGTFTVVATGTNGCVARTTTSVSSNTALPTVNITPSTTAICAGQSVVLTAGGADTYTWSSGQTTPSISASASGPYSVTGIASNGCSNTATTSVTVNPLPTSFSMTGGGGYCAGGTGSLVGLSNSQTGVSYQLLLGGVASGTAVPGTNSPITFGPQNTTGTYTVLATNTSTSCTQTMSGSAVVSVNALPTPSLTASGTLTCAMTSITLTAGGGSVGGPFNYTFSVGADQLGNSSVNTATVTASGAYSVTVTDANGCSATAITSVSSNTTAPSVSITPSATAVCAGQSATFAATPGLASYRWSTPNNGPVLTTATISVSVVGTYSLTVTNSSSCSATAQASLTVNALPTVSIAPPAATICVGQSTTLMASGANTYKWSTEAMTATISVSVAGPYSVTGTTTATGCSNTTTANVTVTPLPNASFTGLPTSVCVDAAPSTLTPTTSGGTFSGPGISGNTFSPATAGAGGPYSITYTVSSLGCPNTSVQSVTVKPLPQAPAVTTQAGHAYPAGVSSLTAYQNTGEVILMVSGCAGGTITWSGGNSQTLSVSTTATGVQTFTATCTSNGCTSPAGTATVTVVAPTLTVSHQDATFGQLGSNTIKPYLLLSDIGTSPIPYSQITVRYWLTVEGNSPITRFENYYVQLGAQNVQATYVPLSQPRQGATAYIEYRFDAAAGVLGAMSNSGPIQNGFGKADYSGFNQADDYSYVTNRDYTLNPRITAYINGQLAYGQEPAGLGSSPQTPVTVSLTATATVFPTTDNTTLVAQAQGGSGVYTYQFSGPGTITPTGNTAVASALPAGVQTFTVVVTDTSTPNAQTATATVSVTVTGPPNTPPTATANANQTATVGVGFTYTVNAFTDAQTPNSLTYTASLSPANGLSFNPTTRVISGTPSTTGVTTVVITATDPGGLSSTSSFSITVNLPPNTPPVATANANQTATVGQVFTYTVNAFADTETPGSLTYAATITPANGLSFTPGTRTISGTPSMSGVSTVTVTATDAGGLSASTSFTITVTPAPVNSQAQLTVLHQDATFGQFNTNTIKPFLLLVNSGTTAIPYSSIKVRYYLTKDAGVSVTNFQNYYVQIGANNVRARAVNLASPVNGADAYVEYTFDAGAGSLTPGANSGPIQNGFTKEDYSGFDQSNDYSYALNRDYTPNARITAYVNNVLVYGTPPAGAPARVGVEEAPLSVQVLGNPLVNTTLEVAVSGAQGQALRYELTDVRGQVVDTRQIEQAGTTDQQTFNVGQQPAGLLLLRVSTPTQSQTVKVLRH